VGAAAGPAHGVVFSGRRYDTGDKTDYLRTVVRLACDRPDLGPEFVAWLKDFVAALKDGEGGEGGGDGEDGGAERDRPAA
jgi:UTP--glucose-1-phosphate uridylyltransferase